MRDTRSNGARPAVKDPDWRPTPTPTGFWPLPEDHALSVWPLLRRHPRL